MRHLLCLWIGLVLSGSLYAHSLACNAGPGWQAYASGFNEQVRIMRDLWENSYQRDCGDLRRFMDHAHASLRPNEDGGGSFQQCHHEGRKRGMAQALGEVQNECGSNCAKSGAAVGELAGKQYCAVGATAYSSPTKLCDAVAQKACRSALMGVVNASAGCRLKSRRDHGFSRFVNEVACAIGQGP